MADFYGGGNDDVVTGSAGSDFLYGGGGNDDITGLGGDDYLNGDQGNDTVYGGEGNDTINSNYGESTSYGGAGNDVIYASGYEEGGFQSIEGGDGEDTINVDMYGGIDYVYDPALGYETEVTINPATADIDGGNDNDDINVNIYGGSATVDGGAGDDSISVNVSASDGVTITTGTGTDTVSVGQLYNGADVVITDFTAGAGGDVMDALSILQAVSYVINPPNENPFATGHLELVQDGTSTLLVLVNDPVDMPSETQTLITFENTTATDFTGDNFSPAISPDGSPIPGETFNGTSGYDYLQGGFGGDTIFGGGDTDDLYGGFGDDFIYGGNGDDNLSGGAGSDDLRGNNGNDYINGDGGNDTLNGGSGNDYIEAYSNDGGDDISITGGDGDDTVYVNLYGETAYSYDPYGGSDVLVDAATAVVDAGDDNDTVDVSIYGGSSDIDAGAGDDAVTVGGNQDATITLGAGQDTVRVDSISRYNGNALEITDFETGAGGDVFDMDPVIGVLNSTTFSDGNPYASGHLELLQVGSDVELIVNSNPDDIDDNEVFSLITFRNVNAVDFVGANFTPPIDPDGSPLPGETFNGTSGSDYLSGTLGADLINGKGDDDYLYGGSGEDEIFGGGGNDTIYGGAGADTLTGGNGDDYIYDDRGDGVFKGNAGNDYLNIDYAYDGASRTFFGGDGDDQINANVQGITDYDEDTNTETIIALAEVSVSGGDGNDQINIDAQYGTADIDAGAGDDTINARATEGLTITTGSGADTVILNGYDLSADTVITDFTTGVGGDVLSINDFEGLLNNTDYSNGNPFDTGHLELLQVGADTHFVINSNPDDEFGNITSVVVVFENTDATTFVVENFNPGIDPAGGPIVGETFQGTSDYDYFDGTLGGDTMFGSGGEDELNGRSGDDEIYGGNGTDNIYGGTGDDFLVGGNGDDFVYGGSGSNSIRGNSGNDRIQSEDYDNSGADVTIDGGDGEDDIYVYAQGDVEFGYNYGVDLTINDLAEVSIDGGDGNDTIRFQAQYGTADVDAGDGDDQITGSASEGITITTGSGVDSITLNGLQYGDDRKVVITDFTTGIGGDVLDMSNVLGLLGATNFRGGNPYATGHLALEQDGADTTLVIYPDPDDVDGSNSFVLITFENADATTFDVANFDPAINPDGSPIPGITIDGTSDQDYLFGTIGGDLIRGFGEDDYLQGESGEDDIFGGGGNDTIYSGAGNDSVTGGNGDDYIYGGGGDDVLRGNNGNDVIEVEDYEFNFDALGGIDSTIYAGNGDDQITVRTFSIVENVPGTDDVTVVDSSDIVVDAGDGNDTIFVSVENGTADIDAGDGDDTIEIFQTAGGATITTGAGSDVVNIASFEFDGVAVTITDFTAGNSGDLFSLNGMINQLYSTNYGGGNPFTTGHFGFEQVGSDVHLSIVAQPDNPDNDDAVLVAIFENTLAGDFNATNFDPAVGPEGNPFPGETFIGTEFGDYLQGTIGGDTLNGLEGDDGIYGGFGNDEIYGGAGEDYLNDDRGDDLVYGGDDDDRLYSYEGNDTLYGDDGDDEIEVFGQERDVFIDGGDNDDQIRVGLNDGGYYDAGLDEYVSTGIVSNVTVHGGRGNDQIEVEADGGTAIIDGGNGRDFINVEVAGGVTITTGGGDDTVVIRDAAYYQDNDVVITDFSTGLSGDVLVLETLFDTLDNTSFVSGNPFGTGHFALVQDGADVRLELNTDPGDVENETFTLVTLQNTTAADFVADNFLPVVDPGGAAVTDLTITGTSGEDELIGGLGDDIIDGLEDNDFIIGSLGADTAYGGDGVDEIEGGLGDDKLYGGNDNDFINGGRGNDSLYGGSGDDTLRDFAGSNIAYGGGGEDYIRLDLYGGNEGSVRGGNGEDSIQIEAYDDSIIAIDAGSDNDDVNVYGEGDYDDFGILEEAVSINVEGKGGDDFIRATAFGGSVTVDGGDGVDTFEVSATESLLITTGTGSDTIVLDGAKLLEDNDYRVTDFTTGEGGDVLDLFVDDVEAFYDRLPSEIDVDDVDLFAPDIFALNQVGADAVLSLDLDGSTGDVFGYVVLMTFENTNIDDFSGANFNLNYVPDQNIDYNEIFGTDATETIDGTSDSDEIFAGKGADVVRGRAGDDLLFGENGKDKLIGGGGNDILVGGGGKDELIGGNDDDFFAFFDGDTQVATNKRDVIADFTDGDRIVVQTLDADTNTVGVTEMFAFADTTAAANSVWYEVDGSNVIVNGDVDGDAVADFAIEVIGISSLDADDFLF